MPYLQLDLDAKRRMPAAANAAGVAVGQMTWGLLETWEGCWREKRESVTLAELAGYFNTDSARVADALVAFGFAERLDNARLRVKGAKRYLRISEARSEAGKRGAKAKHLPSNCQANSEESPDFAKQLPSKTVALSSIIDHRASDKESPPTRAHAEPAPAHRLELEPGEFQTRIADIFREVTGQRMAWRQADEDAVRELIRLSESDDELVLVQWRRALRHKAWPKCRSLRELVQHWGHYGPEKGDGPPRPGSEPRREARELDARKVFG